MGVYKKNREIFREALVWELSILLGCDLLIAPSLPFYIHGGEAIFQPFFPLSCIGRFVRDGQELPIKIPLEDYWIFALYTFLIGHSDLNGENLHFTDGGYLLADNDSSFPPYNRPISIDGHFLSVPLQNVLMDFDYSEKPLTETAYEKVLSTLIDWRKKEQDVKIFFAMSSLVQQMDCKMSQQAFWERWDKILYTPLSPTITFRAFIQTLFPDHFKQIDVAQKFASQILGYSVGPMSALHLLGPFLRYYPVNESLLHEVYEWIKSNYMY